MSDVLPTIGFAYTLHKMGGKATGHSLLVQFACLLVASYHHGGLTEAMLYLLLPDRIKVKLLFCYLDRHISKSQICHRGCGKYNSIVLLLVFPLY